MILRKIIITGAALAFCATAMKASAAEIVKVYAAGSLRHALTELIAAANLPDVEISPTFGPSGLLRERIEKGEPADLFLSADMAAPRRLAAAHPLVIPIIPFARNSMCVAGAKTLALTPAKVLDEMLSDGIKLATSTPGIDPGGDYALLVFKRADSVHPGAGKVLESKALHLLGTANAIAPVENHTSVALIFLGKHADLLLYYCSGAQALSREVSDIVSTPLPTELDPNPVYGMAVLTTNPNGLRFALFILSEQGQSILIKNGLKQLLPDP